MKPLVLKGSRIAVWAASAMANVGVDCGQLAADGYCIVDQHDCFDLMRDMSEIISSWFEHASPQQKRDSAASPTHTAGAASRGYFAMPAKEVLEVSQAWRGSGVSADLRLAAKSAFSTLQQVACDTADTVLRQSNRFKVSQQQLKELLGQQQSGCTQLHNSSILHINYYRPAGPAATGVEEPGFLRLQGREAHIDRGLVTVIYAIGSGLEVLSRDGVWIPVNPGPGQLVILVGHTLSFMTAGRLPAALHRVVTPPASQGADSTSSRLSLCFKLRAAPDALLSPAKVTGIKADELPTRYRVPKTSQQLLEEFDATHISIHSPPANAVVAQQLQPGEQQQQQVQHEQQPTAARHNTQSRVTDSTRSSLEQAQKRQRLNVPPADDQHTGRLLNFIIRNQTGLDVHFKVKPNMKFRKVMDAYSTHIGSTDYRLIFNCARIDLWETPASLEMVDGDIVDAFLEQFGD